MKVYFYLPTKTSWLKHKKLEEKLRELNFSKKTYRGLTLDIFIGIKTKKNKKVDLFLTTWEKAFEGFEKISFEEFIRTDFGVKKRETRWEKFIKKIQRQ